MVSQIRLGCSKNRKRFPILFKEILTLHHTSTDQRKFGMNFLQSMQCLDVVVASVSVILS